MAGTWPNMDLSDMETRLRTYLNEAVASFFLQTAVYRYLSLGVKEVAQRALCVRRILDAVTTASSRTVAVNAYKVHFVEYGGKMLRKIDPLKLGNQGFEGANPQGWYPFGSGIGIEPLPLIEHKLRLYVSDMPKICHATYPISSFLSGWAEKAGHAFWTTGTGKLVFTGTALNDENDMEGPALAASTNYTFVFTVSDLASAQVIAKAGTTAGPAITENGIHSVTLTSSTGTPKLTFTAKDLKTAGGGTVAVDDVYILKEADFANAADQTELSWVWQHLVVLYAFARALSQDGKSGAARMIDTLFGNEIEYLRQLFVDNIPDGKNNQKYQ